MFVVRSIGVGVDESDGEGLPRGDGGLVTNFYDAYVKKVGTMLVGKFRVSTSNSLALRLPSAWFFNSLACSDHLAPMPGTPVPATRM